MDFSLIIGEKMVENVVVPSQNCRSWVKENPNFQSKTTGQKYKKVKVYCGLMYHKIIGHYFLEKRLFHE